MKHSKSKKKSSRGGRTNDAMLDLGNQRDKYSSGSVQESAKIQENMQERWLKLQELLTKISPPHQSDKHNQLIKILGNR